MKKILPLLSLFFLITAQAQEYFGMNNGLGFIATHKKISAPIDGSPTSIREYDAAYVGYHGQLFGGYTFMLKNAWSLALEGDFDFYAGQSQFTIENFYLSNDAQAIEKLRYGYAFFALPQYQLSKDIYVFMGPGVGQSAFDIKSGAQTGGSVGMTGTFHPWLTGWGFKLGTGISVTPRVNITLTYEYFDFEHTTLTAVEPLTAQTIQGRYEPSEQSILVGLAAVV
jgi:opacity protein-like surface antigen